MLWPRVAAPGPDARRAGRGFGVDYASYRAAWDTPGWPLWKILDLPRHLTFITPRALDLWLRAAGLERVGYQTPVLDALWLYVLSAARRAGRASGLSDRVARILAVGARCWLDLPVLVLDAIHGRGLQAMVVLRRPAQASRGVVERDGRRS